MKFSLLPTRYGYQFALDSDKYVTTALRDYYEYSPNEVALWRQFIPVGATVFDVGANQGAHTLALRDIVGPTGTVVAFEPQLTFAGLIRASATVNQFGNIHVLPIGLSNESGYLKLARIDYTRSENYGRVPLDEITVQNGGYEVLIDTIDNVCSRKGYAPQFIKIDVEGMERNVLLGATRTIANLQPWLFVEADRFTHNRELLQTLESFGYRSYWTILPHYENDTGLMTFNFLSVPSHVTIDGLGEPVTSANPDCPITVVYDDAQTSA